MNMRVVLLKRTTTPRKEQYETPLPLNLPYQGAWVTMGHFDSIYAYPLEVKKRNLFSVMHDNNTAVAALNNADNYHHPLYLLTEDDDRPFWAETSWFLSVTRIHLASTIVDPVKIQQLCQQIRALCQQAGCSCFVYHTVELSDLILTVQSSRISNITRVVLNLWSCPDIGKMYTYCGIRYACLQDCSLLPDADDRIDFLSMRFAVHNSGHESGFVNLVKGELGANPVYSVAGVDDILLNFENLPARNLIRLFRRWFVTGLPEGVAFSCIFSDLTTRLGAWYQPHSTGKGAPPSTCDPVLVQMCEDLEDRNKRVQDLARTSSIDDIDTYWLRILSELVHSLLRISRSALLDEFVYLMYPGVQAFLHNLELLLKNSELSPQDRECCWRFLGSWSDLLEHVMRMEGQLTHHPDTRPILYDIPLVLMEYTLAFLEQCSRILQSQDNPPHQIRFILSPKLQTRISTMELFESNHQYMGLLQISIPFHMMYNAQYTQIALCHELAHFVGESHRNRNIRTTYFLQAAAATISKMVFQTPHKGLVSQLEETLTELADTAQSATIADLAHAIQCWLEEKLLNPACANEHYIPLIGKVIRSRSEESRFSIRTDFDSMRNLAIEAFYPVFRALTESFREIFSDICMMILLDLDAPTYLQTLCPDLDGQPFSTEVYAIRIHVTLDALGEKLPPQTSVGASEPIKALYQAIGQLRSEKEPYSLQIPREAVTALSTYASTCAADTRKLVQDRPELDRLQVMYKNITSKDIRYPLLQEYLNDYRANMLSQFLSP